MNKIQQNIISTNVKYTYGILINNIMMLKATYPFIEVGTIGKSVLQKNIPYLKIGKGAKEIFYNASFHANEWITTPVLMKFIEEFAEAYILNKKIFNYSAEQLYNNVTLYVVPMVNPDGVDLVTGGLKNVDNSYTNAQKIANEFSNIPFPNGWKANIRGVDLKNYQPICKIL